MLGAELVVDPAAQDPVAAFRAATQGQGPQIVMEAAGGHAGGAARRGRKAKPDFSAQNRGGVCIKIDAELPLYAMWFYDSPNKNK